MKIILLFVTFLFFGFNSFSQTQMELNEKAYKEYKEADKKLNKIYKELMASLIAKEQKELLGKTQKAWITFRDGEAALIESYYDGGSMQPMMYSIVMTQITQARIKQIEEDIDALKNR